MLDPQTLKEIKDIFKIELVEQHQVMIDALLKLKLSNSDRDAIDDAYRSAHTIKGSAKSLGIDGVSNVAEDLEKIYNQWRHNGSVPINEHIDSCVKKADEILEIFGKYNE